jgi:hypothetical protein
MNRKIVIVVALIVVALVAYNMLGGTKPNVKLNPTS